MKQLSKMSHNSYLDRMIGFLQNPDSLLTAESEIKERFERITYVDAQIRKYPRLAQAAKAIMNNPLAPVGRTHAYQLIKEAQYIYGSTSMYDKKYYKDILIQKALETLDFCARNNRVKDFNLTMANLIKLFGFDRTDENTITAEMLKQHQFLVMVNFKNSEDSYSLDLENLNKMSISERMQLLKEVEAENVEFDMIAKIDEEELANDTE